MLFATSIRFVLLLNVFVFIFKQIWPVYMCIYNVYTYFISFAIKTIIYDFASVFSMQLLQTPLFTEGSSSMYFILLFFSFSFLLYTSAIFACLSTENRDIFFVLHTKMNEKKKEKKIERKLNFYEIDIDHDGK